MEHQEHAMHVSKDVRRHVNIVPNGHFQHADHISVTKQARYVLLALIVIFLLKLGFGGDFATVF